MFNKGKSKYSAIEIAKWFIKNNLDNPRDEFWGNMKLQKLLYFAQLIHLYKYDEVLFEEPIRAFERGPVVESVRQTYKNDNNNIVEQAKKMKDIFDKKVEDTLNLTAEIFGPFDAHELSDMSHDHECWERSLENSKNQYGFYEKDKSIIPIKELRELNLDNISQIIEAKRKVAQLNHKKKKIKCITFNYDPEEIDLDEELIDELRKFKGRDKAYTIYKDSSQGLVIY